LTVKQHPGYRVLVAGDAQDSPVAAFPPPSTDGGDLSVGFLLGLLVGEGHFGGDGRQPQVTLRMHVRHEETFEWLRRTYPGSALYGPYHHGGRSYFQWSARGRYLREYLVPLVQRHRSLLDAYTAARFDTMCERYAIAREGVGASSEA
jgi:hypothetical protein